MKRTGEIILTSIGLVLSFLGTLIITIVLFFTNTDTLKDVVKEGAQEEGVTENLGDIESYLNVALGVGWIIIVILLISLILAAVSIYFFAGNKKPIAASVIIIIVAIIITIGTAFAGIVPGVLYLIAGIMGLVRKPPITNDPHVPETNLHREQRSPDEFN